MWAKDPPNLRRWVLSLVAEVSGNPFNNHSPISSFDIAAVDVVMAICHFIATLKNTA